MSANQSPTTPQGYFSMNLGRPGEQGQQQQGQQQQQQQNEQKGSLTFSPMLVVMPDTTYQMTFRYRLRRHSTHNPRGAISRISDLFTFPIHVSRRTHPSRERILYQLSVALAQAAVSPPWSDPRLWVFQVTAEISNKMPKMRDAGYSDCWPYVPVTLNQGKFTVDVLSRCGPPPLEVLVGWLQGSGKMAVRASPLLADYSILYAEEHKVDATSERRYILNENEIALVLAGGAEFPMGGTTEAGPSNTGAGGSSGSAVKRPLSSDPATQDVNENEKKIKTDEDLLK